MSDIVEDPVNTNNTNEIDQDEVDSVLREWLDRKVPVLPTFPADMKLDGSNYSIWKVMMEAVLKTYDLALLVLTEFGRPDDSIRFGLSMKELAQNKKSAGQWDRLNARIRSFIFLNCTPKVIGHIKHMTVARKIWIHLDQMYNRMTPMKRAALEVQMRTLDSGKSASMRDHIDKLQALQQEILQAGKVISSEDMAIVLLCHLPPRYGAFYSSLITSGRVTDLTWEELVPMVLDQEDRFQSTSGKAALKRFMVRISRIRTVTKRRRTSRAKVKPSNKTSNSQRIAGSRRLPRRRIFPSQRRVAMNVASQVIYGETARILRRKEILPI